MFRRNCLYLPEPEANMSYRNVREAGSIDDFYFVSLQYGHYLWRKGHAGRSILSITRGLYSNISERSPHLAKWPLPYRAIHWVVSEHPKDDFPGNPRISFQHQATRMSGRGKAIRQARAWAVWYLVCAAKPNLQGDLNQRIKEPEASDIVKALKRWGHPDEADIWLKAI